MSNHKYLIYDEQVLNDNVCDMLSQLKHLYNDDNGYYFYGGGKIPHEGEEGSEIECSYNKSIMETFIPKMKKIIKGHSNWSNMSKSDKIVANHIRFFCNVLTKKKMARKTMRFPKFKSFMVNKFSIPNEIIIK